MHCELAVPGLFSAPAGPRLPALELLLARGRRACDKAETLESWLQQRFELDALPAGALTMLGAGGDPGRDFWVRADPVHLRLMRDRLILAPAEGLGITRDEADALCKGLARHFGSALEFHVIEPGRWCVRLQEEPGLGGVPPLDIAGREVAVARSGSALMNEIQMLLHALPSNEAREARGDPAVNSVWFWGPGRVPEGARVPWHSMSADDPLVLGLARLAGVRHRKLDKDAASWLERAPGEGRHLVVLDALRAPLALADEAEARAAIDALERDWFAPLLAALRSGRIGMLSLHVPDVSASLSFETIRGDLRRFWRRPKTLASYA